MKYKYFIGREDILKNTISSKNYPFYFIVNNLSIAISCRNWHRKIHGKYIYIYKIFVYKIYIIYLYVYSFIYMK